MFQLEQPAAFLYDTCVEGLLGRRQTTWCDTHCRLQLQSPVDTSTSVQAPTDVSYKLPMFSITTPLVSSSIRDKGRRCGPAEARLANASDVDMTHKHPVERASSSCNGYATILCVLDAGVTCLIRAYTMLQSHQPSAA